MNVVCQLAPVPGKLSQVTFPYKVVINNDYDYRKAFLNIECKKKKS